MHYSVHCHTAILCNMGYIVLRALGAIGVSSLSGAKPARPPFAVFLRHDGAVLLYYVGVMIDDGSADAAEATDGRSDKVTCSLLEN